MRNQAANGLGSGQSNARDWSGTRSVLVSLFNESFDVFNWSLVLDYSSNLIFK